MPRPRVRTSPLDGNQERIDELEYFLDRIASFTFGDAVSDYRQLGELVWQTRNLSALVELGRRESRDVAEDLRILDAELEAHAGPDAPVTTPSYRADSALFQYRLYADLLAHPEKLLHQVAPEQRLEVVNRITSGLSALAPLLARLNAYAWLAVVGAPDFHAEMQQEAPAELRILDDPPRWESALQRVLAVTRLRARPGLDSYARVVYRELTAGYRSQLARLAGRTQPLG